MKALQKIYEQKIVAIIRGFKPRDTLSIAGALRAGGIEVVEVTMNSPRAIETIELLSSEFENDIVIGAGTVLDPETCRSAILAGAQFILSPTLSIQTIQMAKRYNVTSIPGAMTPTEILTAHEVGGDIIKVFPVNFHGSTYVKDLLGPLPQLSLLPTGGIDLNNITDYLNAGAVGVGLGGALVHPTHEVSEKYLQTITEKAKKFVHSVTDC